MKNVSLGNDQCLVGRPVLHKDFIIAIFWNTIKFCMMVALIELYPFIPLSETLITFQGHSSIKQFIWKCYVLTRLRWNFVGLLSTSSRSWIYHFPYVCTYTRDITDICPHLKKKPVGFDLVSMSQVYQEHKLQFMFLKIMSVID